MENAIYDDMIPYYTRICHNWHKGYAYKHGVLCECVISNNKQKMFDHYMSSARRLWSFVSTYIFAVETSISKRFGIEYLTHKDAISFNNILTMVMGNPTG